MIPQIGDSVTVEVNLPHDRQFNAPEGDPIATKGGKIVSVNGNTVKVRHDRTLDSEPDPMPETSYKQSELEALDNGQWKISRTVNGVQTTDRMPI